MNTVSGLLAQDQSSTPWRCDEGHILGVVTKKRSHGQWRYFLLKFRNAARSFDDEVEVDASIEGTARDIRCNVCAGLRTWFVRAELPRDPIRRV